MAFKRITEKEDGTTLEREVYDKVVILNEYSLYTVDRYAYMHNVLIKLLNNIDLDKNLRDYFSKYISGINNLKALKISNLDSLNLNEYKEKIDTISKDLYKENIDNNAEYKLLNAKLFKNEEEFDEFLNKNTDNNDWIAMFQYNDSNIGFGLEFVLSESLYKDNKYEIILFIEKITGNFDMDLLLLYKELLNNFTSISKSKEINKNHVFLDFSKYNYHLEIIILMNRIFSDITYLLNSTSFNRNELFDFDVSKLESDFELFSYLLRHSYDVFEYQYTY